mmetsp:Transcript_20771/g.38623  ORF Transcript_20771/g.38623 Transcript_20771/m.38623 type:complete len:574 (-) Transcript_20771:117-1838(-)|eukprot:CAMPEP_0204910520 /NCGR_PEP_ID=MMETSP1397-20131031/9027_1 /ASSEMBLY_ACC=CAM_ASM_000891 /TAXON_ID=49980 /ORGANISM="Climacostomum Climacostomum virens, Strain Stock W-24" /LENGTH=573 /DNA_ID=CAMNT_0052080717 /DNA_START=16 /DNA_END=1737 /DNA_ORIENTATION=+
MEVLNSPLTKVAAGVGLVGGIVWLSNFFVRRKWRAKAQAKRKERDDQPLPKMEEVSEDLTMFILSLTSSELTAAIKAGKCSCRQVVIVYVHRVFEIGRRLNLSAEENFAEALAIADRLDRKLAINPEDCGLLFGVPISIKDHIDQKGKLSTCGASSRLHIVSSEDALVVKLLLDQDAIPIVRGNVCQIMMWLESENFIFGRALNPWDLSRTVGGSSGGDAGLVAARCVVVGIGSDIGGSVRYPAHFCGLATIKPTPQRVSLRNVTNPHPSANITLIEISLGPMARSVADLKTVMESWFVPQMWDEDFHVHPLPFNHALYQTAYASPKLRIGYYTEAETFTPCTSVVRAVIETVEKLRRLGHELVEVKLPDLAYATKLYANIMLCTGSHFFSDSLQGEDRAWFNKVIEFTANHVNAVRFFLRLFGMGQEADCLEGVRTFISVEELTQIWREIEIYKRKMADFWVEHELDNVISPIYCFPAPLHEGTMGLMAPCSYSFLWNTVAYPAGMVPVTNVLESETSYSCESSIFTKYFNQTMAGAAGMPVGVQVIGLPNKDEQVLAVMQLIEQMAGFRPL